MMRTRRTRKADSFFQELGKRTYASILEFLEESGGDADGMERAVNRAIAPLAAELEEVKERLERLESDEAAAEEPLRRQPRAARPIRKRKRPRLQKAEVRRRALEAARQMLNEGGKLTMAATARRAGLNYNQIVYAFGGKSAFLREVGKLE